MWERFLSPGPVRRTTDFPLLGDPLSEMLDLIDVHGVVTGGIAVSRAKHIGLLRKGSIVDFTR
jgi:hypothetical protein